MCVRTSTRDLISDVHWKKLELHFRLMVIVNREKVD